jgi:hypothetical protein
MFNRSLLSDLSDNDIYQIIRRIVLKGTRVDRRPGINTYKIKYQNLGIVARYYKDKIAVITFLGDGKYQRWYTHHEVRIRKKKVG